MAHGLSSPLRLTIAILAALVGVFGVSQPQSECRTISGVGFRTYGLAFRVECLSILVWGADFGRCRTWSV